jgi:hypothetical protein
MSRNSSIFDHHAFLQSFTGREQFLEEYLNSIPRAGITITRPVTDAGAFSTHLDLCPQEEYRALTSGMVECWEMASGEGHDQLLAALQQADMNDPMLVILPAECLALHLLSTRRDLFETALSLDEVRKCESLQMFKPQRAVSLVQDLNAATNAFRTEMATSCGERFGSRRILLRRFEGTDLFTIGFYFEKSPKTQRRLTGTEAEPSLERDEARLLQFDAAVFEARTGMLGVRSGHGRLTNQIRRAFASAFLNDPAAYEWEGAGDILDLAALFDPDLDMEDASGNRHLLTEADYSPSHDEFMARYRVTGADVHAILQRDNRTDAVQHSRIRKLVLKMAVEGTARRKKVTLTAPNKLDFKRGSDTEQIIDQLHDWNVLRSHEIQTPVEATA